MEFKNPHACDKCKRLLLVQFEKTVNKMVRSKKDVVSPSTSSSSLPHESSELKRIGVDIPGPGGIVKKSSQSPAKKKVEKAINQFLSDMLPTLKKEMVKRKKEPFSWENYQGYFRADSGYLQTYILPLFKFLEKDEIICSRYGLFDNRHMVKTSAGFDHVMFLSKNCDSETLPADVQQYLRQRFGKEWFKIPSKDSHRAKAAANAGHEGCFKVILTGLFEDSFTDTQTGETVHTINPSLAYEPCRPPPPKKERSAPSKKKKKEAVSEEEEENDGDNDESPCCEVGAQEVPIEPVEDGGEDGEE